MEDIVICWSMHQDDSITVTGGRIQVDSLEVKSYEGLEIWMDLWQPRTMGNNSHRRNVLLSFLYYARIGIRIVSNN